MPTLTRVTANGRDLGTDFGWEPDAISGWLDGIGRSHRVVTVPRRLGGMLVVPGQAEPRELTIGGTIRKDTVADRVTTEDRIKAQLASGLLRVRIDDGGTAKEILGYLQGPVRIRPLVPKVTSLASRIEATIICPNPVWRAPKWTVIGLPTAGQRYVLPIGTATSTPLVRIMGSGSNFIVTLRSPGGKVIGVPLNFSGTSLTGSEWLDIDNRRGLIDKVASDGTRTRAIHLRTSGTFPFALSPRRCDPENGHWITAEVSAGSAEFLYPKGWE